VIRSVDALSGTGAIAIGETAHPAGWRALRGAMGSTFRTPVARATLDDAVEAARRRHIRIVATASGAATPIDRVDFRRGSLVLMGNEGGQGSAQTVGDVGRIKVPVLLLRHRRDACRATPPADADRFKSLLAGAPKVDIVTLDGGGPAGSGANPCGASHFHGFYGIDDQAVAATVQWLGANMRR